MTATASLMWFARHELVLAWREWAQMAAVRSRRDRWVLLGAMVFVALLHWLAYAILAGVLPGVEHEAKSTLIALTASVLLTFSMMLSQAIEHVTRAFYARSDLDLILSSPASSQSLFAVRIVSIAVSGAALTALMTAPLINAAILIDGLRWAWAYAVVACLSVSATGLAVLASLALFRVCGPRRARLISQIVAAVVGAALLIGLQVAGILAYGNLSRFSILSSSAVVGAAPGVGSWLWIPARAMLGDTGSVLILLACCSVFFATVVAICSPYFSSGAIAAASVGDHHRATRRRSRPFRVLPTGASMRGKELLLLARDPWLISQSLMQVLYLIPPAILLWREMGKDAGVEVLLAPVLVMAFGQLAGGLSWLTISGEDAPELIATAPVPRGAITRAKVEAVLLVIAVVATPLVLCLGAISMRGAMATGIGIVASAASAVVIQLWFRSTARRSQFRKRQTATKLATLSEAFSSVFWAGAAGFAAAGLWIAGVFVALALLTLWLTWLIRPGEGY